ncbi:hypothetical protein [Burkholderia ubonensis]|uniref:hypothetical protein n=1 Tax=Burkholderia ubonensis TaxID=101571 RepID=UPI000AFEFFD9|nr:hypothetical protein [Burkholderia ubonensis]
MSDAPKRLICFTPENLELAIADDCNNVVRLSGMEKEAGLTPGVGMMMVLTPTEARGFAEALLRNADQAESGLPRA